MTKRALAREWLWLVVSLLAAIGIVFGWTAPPDPVSASAVVLVLTVVVYSVAGSVRLTWWAVKTALRSGEPQH